MTNKLKLGLPVLALIAGATASAFTVPNNSGMPYETADYWYKYTGSQDPTARTKDSNYSNPQITDFPCNGGADECAVQVKVTLDALGNPPNHPDLTGASFDPSEGYPEVDGSLIMSNDLQP